MLLSVGRSNQTVDSMIEDLHQKSSQIERKTNSLAYKIFCWGKAEVKQLRIERKETFSVLLQKIGADQSSPSQMRNILRINRVGQKIIEESSRLNQKEQSARASIFTKHQTTEKFSNLHHEHEQLSQRYLALDCGVFDKLKNDDASVRQAATADLGLAVKKGDKRAIAAVMLKLEDADASVRETAAVALHPAVMKGDKSVIEGLIGRLEHAHVGVRQAVLAGLAPAIEKGDRKTIEAVVARLDDNHAEVRQAVLAGLAPVIEKGDRKTIKAVVARLDDNHAEVRQAALAGLAPVIEKGDRKTIEAVVARLDDDHAKVRGGAVLALAPAVERENEKAISAVVARSKDDDASVRKLAVMTLYFAVEKKDESAISAISDRLEDDDASVRKTAVSALNFAVIKENEDLIQVVSSKMGDSDAGVRKATVMALGPGVNEGNQRSIEILTAGLQDSDAGVREAAVFALGSVVKWGDESAVDAVANKIKDPDAGVRKATVMVLGLGGNARDQRSIEILTAGLQDSDAGVREAAVLALRSAVKWGDKRAVDAVANKLEDPDTGVRKAASTVFAVLEPTTIIRLLGKFTELEIKDFDLFYEKLQEDKYSTNEYFQENSAQIKQKLISMILTASQDAEFKSTFCMQVQANNANCTDRALNSLNELFSSWKMHTLPEGASTVEKFETLEQAAKMIALRKEIDKLITEQEQTTGSKLEESVEISLYYTINLRERLGFTLAVEDMQYDDYGKSDWIDEKKLVEKVEENWFDTMVEMPLLEGFLESDKEFQAKWEPLDEKFQNDMEKIMESSDSGNVVGDARALQENRKDAYKTCVREFFEETCGVKR